MWVEGCRLRDVVEGCGLCSSRGNDKCKCMELIHQHLNKWQQFQHNVKVI